MTKTLIVALAFVLVGFNGAFAQDATTNASKPAQNAGTYAEAMKTCGAEWRASEQRKAVKKGEGAAAWNTFRAECTKRVGYTSKRRGASNS
jgi:hypothetical protein